MKIAYITDVIYPFIIGGKYGMNGIKSFINGNGIIAKPDDMAKAIEFLLKNKKEREKMGKQGMKIAEDFNWDIIAEQTESYYKQVIKNHKQ